jgi:hypothetical protein
LVPDRIANPVSPSSPLVSANKPSANSGSVSANCGREGCHDQTPLFDRSGRIERASVSGVLRGLDKMVSRYACSTRALEPNRPACGATGRAPHRRASCDHREASQLTGFGAVQVANRIGRAARGRHLAGQTDTVRNSCITLAIAPLMASDARYARRSTTISRRMPHRWGKSLGNPSHTAATDGCRALSARHVGRQFQPLSSAI